MRLYLADENNRGSPTSSNPSAGRSTARLEVGVQADLDVPPSLRVSRRLWGNRPTTRRLRVVPERRCDGQLRDLSTTVDAGEKRKICDCITCVTHALLLAEQPYGTNLPAEKGVRFLTLSALSLQRAKREDQSNLIRRLEKSPEKTLVVCGCLICVAHRNLGLAWSQAMKLQDPCRQHKYVPPAAGGCRARD